jgi:ribosomal protein L11 methyltransferase
MSTTVARLACDEPTARRLAATLGDIFGADDAVCSAFEGAGDQWHMAIHFREPPDEANLRAQVALMAGEAAAAALSIEQVAPADWVKQSLADLAPVRAGRFIVHGAHDRARVKSNDIGIEIEAALAFGTGHHGTTRGCLLALDDLAKRRRHSLIPPPARGRVASAASRVGVLSFGLLRNPTPGASRRTRPFQGRDKKILDIGTGSGVLAIAAARILRTRVMASDIDRVAVEAARANARLNRAGAAITFVRAAGANARAIATAAPYDLIFGNILLGPLMRLAVPLRKLAAPGARIVLSGLLPGHANAAIAIYRAQGLVLERRIALDGWVTLVLRR